MSPKSLVRIGRKFVHMIAFLAFLCIPVGLGKNWAPIGVLVITNWPLLKWRMTVCRICVAVSAFLLFRLVQRDDNEQKPVTATGVYSLLIASLVLLSWYIWPMDKFTDVVISFTGIALICIMVCDIAVLRWIAKRGKAEKGSGAVD